MTSPPALFRPQTKPIPLFIDELSLDGVTRRFDLYSWQNRIVACEPSSGLWWGTLDELAPDTLKPHDFWRHCVASDRIGRLLTIERGFEEPEKANGARLICHKASLDVLIAPDNGGLAREHDEQLWHPFRAVAPSRVSKPLAHRPSIWSPRFQTKFARRGLSTLTSSFVDESLGSLPAPLPQLWHEGMASPLLRAVAAAIVAGWAHNMGSHATLPRFWEEVIAGRQRLRASSPSSFPDSNASSQPLPAELQKSWGAAKQGRILLPQKRYYWQNEQTPFAVFIWEGLGTGVMLRVRFATSNDSSHEELEARLELRDWLSQFYPAREVESWFGR